MGTLSFIVKRFLSSVWYPLIISLILAGATTWAFWILEPDANAIGNSEMARIFPYVGWSIGGVLGLLIFLEIGILNLIRRIVRLRKVSWLHPVTILVAILPWLIFGWELTYQEPRFTPIARAIIDFGGEPMYAGCVIASIATLVLAIPLLIPSRKKKK